MNNQTTKILITSGATQEAIDEVRYLGNRSSGKLGSLLAYAASTQGHVVTLLIGPNAQMPAKHPRLTILPYTSTSDLQAKLAKLWPVHTLLIMAAAVADYTPVEEAVTGKIPRGDSKVLEVTATKDLVANLAKSSRDDQRIIAFALEESGNMEERAMKKLLSKDVDAIVANPIQTMESEYIEALVFSKDGRVHTPEKNSSKAQFAHWLISNLNDIANLP